MSIPETLVVTFVATFVATVPAVFIGIYVERKLATKQKTNSAVAFLKEATAPGSVIYNTRDWANAILSSVQNLQPLVLSNSVGSAASLTALVESAGTPSRFRLDLLVLADHVTRLHLIADPHLATNAPVSTATAQMLQSEAQYVADVSRGLIAELNEILASQG